MRILKHLKVKRGTIYLHCSLYPIRCTRISRAVDDISGISLMHKTAGEGWSCSIRNCRPERLTQVQAEALIKAWKEGGERAAMKWRGYTDEAIDQFFKEWRQET